MNIIMNITWSSMYVSWMRTFCQSVVDVYWEECWGVNFLLLHWRATHLWGHIKTPNGWRMHCNAPQESQVKAICTGSNLRLPTRITVPRTETIFPKRKKNIKDKIGIKKKRERKLDWKKWLDLLRSSIVCFVLWELFVMLFSG